jgi:hypothetical protein
MMVTGPPGLNVLGNADAMSSAAVAVDYLDGEPNHERNENNVGGFQVHVPSSMQEVDSNLQAL